MNKNKIADNIKIEYVAIPSLLPAIYNPRKWNEKLMKDLKQSIKNFGVIDPLIINSAPNRKNIEMVTKLI